MSKPSDYRTLLRELTDGGVEFVIVGALAAVLQGAPIVTFDLDILRRRTPATGRPKDLAVLPGSASHAGADGQAPGRL